MHTRDEHRALLPRARFPPLIATGPRKLLAAVAKVFREVNTANEILADHYQRFDPEPENEFLHWEPTASGWRLYGEYLPLGPAGEQ
ncbi:hypothetical protein [Sciscionella sediminilitoris]|uniref:hypothetical protein n=1 Tax=Sciscionella sediminilitoris TaxID=1445613 RepID=UPI0004DEE878|nr:hypothetical protein [Sciscionella sp. SE31]